MVWSFHNSDNKIDRFYVSAQIGRLTESELTKSLSTLELAHVIRKTK